MIAARPVTDFPEAIDAHFGGDCKGCGDNGRLDRETLDSNLNDAGLVGGVSPGARRLYVASFGPCR